MKYVILIVDNKKIGFRRAYPVMFPEYMSHSTMAQFTQQAILEETNEHSFVFGAGFCEVGDGEITCKRGSTSLKISPDINLEVADRKILNLPTGKSGLLL